MSGAIPAELPGDAQLGATWLGGGRTRFLVWAPLAERVDVRVISPAERLVELQASVDGYFSGVLEGVAPGACYFYRLHRAAGAPVDRPDPASRFQPRGVHEASQVISSDYDWRTHLWHGLPLREYVIYEMHVGTFTPSGTFSGILAHLDDLVRLGITAIELMPVAQFPGSRNWGYDGVHPFAVQNTYGTPADLKRLVDACHERGLAVVLDVVFNHLGPEGNYFADFGPYFIDRYRTPWGPAINFDGPHSDEVRRLFIENALIWIDEFRIDALRIDAVHAIFDSLAPSFLRELAATVAQRAAALGRHVHLIAESNKNDPIMFERPEQGGYGLDGVWLDDFHHALHALLTGERTGWYLDFGSLEALGKALREGFVLSGQKSHYRGRRHGRSSAGAEPDRFVVSIQNHDQVGNRAASDRLCQIVDFEATKLAAAATLLSPYVPLIFMGEEYGETAPFYYFVSHSDLALVEAVRAGRLREFAAFAWQQTPADPQDEATFEASKLNHALREQTRHAVVWNLYRRLIELRKANAAVKFASRAESDVRVIQEKNAIVCIRRHAGSRVIVILHFGKEPTTIELQWPTAGQSLELQVDSAAAEWLGPGSTAPQSITGTTRVHMQPRSCVVYA